MISTWIVFSVGLISADGFSIKGIEEIQDVRTPLVEKFGLTNMDRIFSFWDRFGEEKVEVFKMKQKGLRWKIQKGLRMKTKR